MKEKINWQKELIESGKFNDKFSKNLLENGAKNFMQGIYLGYMYSRWRKIRGLDKDDPIENKGQMHHHSKGLSRKSNEDNTYFHYRRIRITSLLTSGLKESTNTKLCQSHTQQHIKKIHQHIHQHIQA